MKNEHPIAINSAHTLVADIDEDNFRIDIFLAVRFSLYSRSFFQKIIKQHLVKINCRLADKSSCQVRHGDIIEIVFPDSIYGRTGKKEMIDMSPINIVIEHKDFLIIDKPAGLLVHAPNRWSDQHTVVDWLVNHYHESKDVGNVDRPGIVHRLDMNTSGLLVLARTNYAYQQFHAMFLNRLIQKTYVALVVGHPENDIGTIDLPIGRDPITKVKMCTFSKLQPHSRAIRTALTHYKVIDRFADTSYVQLHPVTGRTHQLRVHCAALGHPLLGDVVYGQASDVINRQALHAHRLQFQFDDKTFDVMSPLPADIARLCS